MTCSNATRMAANEAAAAKSGDYKLGYPIQFFIMWGVLERSCLSALMGTTSMPQTLCRPRNTTNARPTHSSGTSDPRGLTVNRQRKSCCLVVP